MTIVNDGFAPWAGRSSDGATALLGAGHSPKRPPKTAPWQPRVVRPRSSGPSEKRAAQPSARIRVLVLSEIPLICEGLARIVERMPEAELIDTVSTLPAAAAWLRARPVDVLVLDEQSDPRFDAVRSVVSHYPRTGITVLLGNRAAADTRAAEAVKAGAKNAVGRTARTDLLMDAVRHAVRREFAADSDADSGGFRTVVEFGGPGGVLSPREAEVLQFIAQGLDNQAIAERLVLSVETVRTHARNLARKLGAQSRVQVAAIAYQSGFVTANGGDDR